MIWFGFAFLLSFLLLIHSIFLLIPQLGSYSLSSFPRMKSRDRGGLQSLSFSPSSNFKALSHNYFWSLGVSSSSLSLPAGLERLTSRNCDIHLRTRRSVTSQPCLKPSWEGSGSPYKRLRVHLKAGSCDWTCRRERQTHRIKVFWALWPVLVSGTALVCVTLEFFLF